MSRPNINAMLAHEEAHPFDIPSARRALESVVISQFRALADDLLVGYLAAGRPMSSLAWQLQHLSRCSLDSSALPERNESSVEGFRSHFISSASQQSDTFGPAGLRSTRIRIYGGDASYWQEGKINSQLASLGSSLRLAIVGSARNRLQRIKHLLRSAANSDDTEEICFIVGMVKPVTTFCNATLFEFEREVAISPYLSEWTSTIAEPGRIVLRRSAIHLQNGADFFTGEPRSSSPSTPQIAKWPFDEIRKGLLIHEIAHALFKFGDIAAGHGTTAPWRDIVRADICRFLQVPRSREDLSAVFMEVFEMSDLLRVMFQLPNTMPSYNLDFEVREMLQEGLLRERGELVSCSLFETGREWAVV